MRRSCLSLLFIFTLVTFSSGCSWFGGCSEAEYLEYCELIEQARYAHLGYAEMGGGRVDPLAFSEVIIPYAYELSRTKRLRFEDSKIYFDAFVHRFRVIFSTQNILELCEARALMVDVVEGLLCCLNAHPRVAASFDHAPITAEDLEIYFSFESYFIEYVDPTYMAWMSLHDGLVRYYSGVLKDFNLDFWHERIEPYYKSLRFVEIERAAAETYEREHPEIKEELNIRSLDLDLDIDPTVRRPMQQVQTPASFQERLNALRRKAHMYDLERGEGSYEAELNRPLNSTLIQQQVESTNQDIYQQMNDALENVTR